MTSLENLNWIGMICRIKSAPKLAEHTYTWMFRILVLDLELIKYNTKIICYTPADVNPKEKTVTGFILEGTEFKKVTLPIPQINYDYHFGETDNKGKPGFSYDDFEPWAHQNGYKIYPEKTLRKLANDKLATAKLLAQCEHSIMPRTEAFKKERAQMDTFFQNHSTVFIKPRYGSGGNGIFVVRKENNNKYLVDYYKDSKKITHNFSSIPQFLSSLKSDQYEGYIIQEGVNCVRYEGRIFDIRAVMFKDEHDWHFIHGLRLGAKGKEISNGSQGADTLSTEKVLEGIFPKEKAQEILDSIKITTEKIAAFVNDHIQDKVTELAFDVLVDIEGNLHIAEINIKPGLSGGFAMYDHFFEMSEEEKYIFETQAVKHGEYLAKSLLYRARTA